VLIANKTKESNIAEYVIYMFQIEDLIRANNLDLDTITTSILQPQIKDEVLLNQYKDWYKELIKRMKIEGKKEKGHSSDIDEILMELLMLHDTLINVIDDKKYKTVFEKALPALKDFQQKSGDSNLNLIEIGFNALYTKIILKLKKQVFTQATEDAFKAISELLGNLAAYYKKMKAGELDYTQSKF